MRGKLSPVPRLFARSRNIPAYAGKMLLARSFGRRLKEHPRVCGENFWARPMPFQASGTSPRMRGKFAHTLRLRSRMRNIPAYAGKISGLGPCLSRLPEHPRVCGENFWARPMPFQASGTSPRMRGKFAHTLRLRSRMRNIPAYAGKMQCGILHAFL